VAHAGRAELRYQQKNHGADYHASKTSQSKTQESLEGVNAKQIYTDIFGRLTMKNQKSILALKTHSHMAIST